MKLKIRATSIIISWCAGIMVVVTLCQIGFAQQNDLRGKPVNPQYFAPHTSIPDGRRQAAAIAYNNATPQSLALIQSSDPLLRDIYALYGLNPLDNSPAQKALTGDMKRRGEAAVSSLIDLFNHPLSEGTRGHLLQGIHHNPWINPDRFLPHARAWYAELKKVPQGMFYSQRNYVVVELTRFLSWAGHPEDEEIMRDLVGPDGQSGNEMKDFLTRVEQLKKQSSNPHQSAQAPLEKMSVLKSLTPNAKKAATSEEPSTLWSVIAASIIAAIVLLWLLLKNRK